MNNHFPDEFENPIAHLKRLICVPVKEGYSSVKTTAEKYLSHNPDTTLGSIDELIELIIDSIYHGEKIYLKPALAPSMQELFRDTRPHTYKTWTKQNPHLRYLTFQPEPKLRDAILNPHNNRSIETDWGGEQVTSSTNLNSNDEYSYKDDIEFFAVRIDQTLDLLTKLESENAQSSTTLAEASRKAAYKPTYSEAQKLLILRIIAKSDDPVTIENGRPKGLTMETMKKKYEWYRSKNEQTVEGKGTVQNWYRKILQDLHNEFPNHHNDLKFAAKETVEKFDQEIENQQKSFNKQMKTITY